MSELICECQKPGNLQHTKQQWDKLENCDVVLLVGQEKERIPVSKAVLASSSQYFSSLFTSNFKEQTEDEVDLSVTFDCAETFKDIVAYLHGEKILINYQNVDKYLYVCEVLDMSDVTESCLKFLLLNLTMETSLWTWIIADRYNLIELRDVCKDICLSRFHSFLAFQEYTLELEVENLMILLKQGLARYCKPTQFDTFLDKYISFDLSRESQRSILLDANSQISKTMDADQNSDKFFDKVVVLRDLFVGEHLLIYSCNNDQWYYSHNLLRETKNMEPFSIVYLAVGPKYDHILIKTIPPRPCYYKTYKLINTKTMKLKLIKYHDCDPIYVTRRPNGDIIALLLLYLQNYGHEYHLCKLDVYNNKWELLKIVYQCGFGMPTLLFAGLSEDDDRLIFIAKEDPKPFSVFSFSFLCNRLSELSNFQHRCECSYNSFNIHWKIFQSHDCVIINCEAEHPSYKYHYGSDSWSTVEYMKEIDLAEVNFNCVICSAYSDDETIYHIGLRQKFGHYFIRWNPFTKEHRELCPVPVSKLSAPDISFQVIPTRFLAEFKVADRIPDLDSNAHLIRVLYRDELIQAYRSRTQNY